MIRRRTCSEAETEEVGRQLARELADDAVLLLSGDLGAGKTVLARGIASGLGIDRREIQSPTFTVVREHRSGRGKVIHVDLYRLDPADVAALGLEETLNGPGVKIVEWAERLDFRVPGARALRIARGESERERIIEERKS